MGDEGELQQLLNQYDVRDAAAQKRNEQHKKNATAFREQFGELERNTILPTLDRLHDQIAERGHRLRITGKGTGEITVEVIPRGSEEAIKKTTINSRPHFSFKHLQGTSMVQVYECKMRIDGGGQAGPAKSFESSEVSVDFVTAIAMNILRIAL